MTKKLVGSRIARKQAEDDVKLLANRIALLKMEEQKVSKCDGLILPFEREFINDL